jgi:RND family efflux transporter MFP subunit
VGHAHRPGYLARLDALGKVMHKKPTVCDGGCRRPRFRLAVLMICALLSAVAYSDEDESTAQIPPARQSVLVRTTALTMHTMSATVTAYGRVQPDPDHLTSITLPRAGLVSRVWVRLGQRVSAGQPLLELATAPTARMEYQQAQAAVDFARGKLNQAQSLFKQKLATRDQVADAERGLRDAEARLEAQRKLGTGQSSEVLRAPFAGIITQLPITQGQRVQADTTALLLASGEDLVVPLGVEQEDVTRVRAGQPVTLSPVFRADVSMTTTISEVHAMVDPKTRLVDVFVHIPKEDAPELVLEETVRGVIQLHQARVPAVPRSAVLRDERGAYLYVVRDGSAHRVDVTTGVGQGPLIEVQGGLQAGDKVVTEGNYELSDGMAVREENP